MHDPEKDYGWWATPTGHSARLSLNLTTLVLYLHHPRRGDLPLVCVDSLAAADALLAGYGEAGGTWAWLTDRLPPVQLAMNGGRL